MAAVPFGGGFCASRSCSVNLPVVLELSELKDERDDSLNSFSIGGVLIGELFAHHFFFVARFDPQAYGDEDESDDSPDVPLLNGGCDDHGKQAGWSQTRGQLWNFALVALRPTNLGDGRPRMGRF